MQYWTAVTLAVLLTACAERTTRIEMAAHARDSTGLAASPRPTGSGGARPAPAVARGRRCDPAAQLRILAQELAAMKPGYRATAVASGLEIRGPRTTYTRCQHGDDASAFRCRSERGPARYLLRVQDRRDFVCPEVPQSSIHAPGRLPALEDECFYYFVSPSVGVRDYGKTAMTVEEVTDRLRKTTRAEVATPDCPDW